MRQKWNEEKKKETNQPPVANASTRIRTQAPHFSKNNQKETGPTIRKVKGKKTTIMLSSMTSDKNRSNFYSSGPTISFAHSKSDCNKLCRSSSVAPVDRPLFVCSSLRGSSERKATVENKKKREATYKKLKKKKQVFTVRYVVSCMFLFCFV